MLDNKVIIDLDDYVDDIDVDLSDVVIASSTPIQLQSKSVNPTTSSQTITADVGYDGLSSVTINAVTSAIDNNIQPSNIKKDVSILGVVGTLVDNSDAIIEGTATNVNTGATKTIGSLFYYNDNIISFVGNSITTFGERTFQRSRNLETCIAPNTTSMGDYCFNQCQKLTSLSFPLLTSFGQVCFNSCTLLEEIDLGLVGNITVNTFSQDTSLTKITLRRTSVCGLASLTGFPASSTQHITIYVPSSLISSYQTATNWSTLYNNGYIDFQAIS